MSNLENLGTGLIYRNPVPHLFSRQGYFPSVVKMDNGEMLASVAIGEAFEAVNLHTYVMRSADEGETWSAPVRLFENTTGRLKSDTARLTALPGGEVIALVVRCDREDHPEDGLANEANLGFVPTEVLIVRSHDYGRTWDEPEVTVPPLEGSEFEICGPIMPLRDGRWIWSTSTWRTWDGDCPNGLKMLAFVSEDEGKSWSSYFDVMKDESGPVYFWEGKIVERADGSLLAVAWVYDETAGADRENHYSISRDGGATWLPPASTGLQGQTMDPVELPDGRIFSVYRRMDEPGLWANIARVEGDIWINETSYPLWGAREKSLLDKPDDNMVHQFNELKFGAPTVKSLGDGVYFIAFWCYEKNNSNIRWIKVRVS